MKYFRTDRGFVRVYADDYDCPSNDEKPVVVIDKEKWDRLVEIVELYDPEADAIIQEVGK